MLRSHGIHLIIGNRPKNKGKLVFSACHGNFLGLSVIQNGLEIARSSIPTLSVHFRIRMDFRTDRNGPERNGLISGEKKIAFCIIIAQKGYFHIKTFVIVISRTGKRGVFPYGLSVNMKADGPCKTCTGERA